MVKIGQNLVKISHRFSQNYLYFDLIYIRIQSEREVIVMAAKTANVLARVEPDVKEQAENILSQLGIPASVLINMLYLII